MTIMQYAKHENTKTKFSRLIAFVLLLLFYSFLAYKRTPKVFSLLINQIASTKKTTSSNEQKTKTPTTKNVLLSTTTTATCAMPSAMPSASASSVQEATQEGDSARPNTATDHQGQLRASADTRTGVHRASKNACVEFLLFNFPCPLSLLLINRQKPNQTN